MQQGAVEGVLIDIGLSRAKVFRLLTTNRHKLSRQDAYGVGGNSVGKPVAETFPAVALTWEYRVRSSAAVLRFGAHSAKQ